MGNRLKRRLNEEQRYCLRLSLSLNSLPMHYLGADGNFDCPACGTTGKRSRRMLKKAVQQGRSEESTGSVASGLH